MKAIMHNRLEQEYRHKLSQYEKLRNRYEKRLSLGTFEELSLAKRNRVTGRISRLLSQLQRLQGRLGIAAASGVLALSLSTTAAAQSPSGDALKKQPLIPSFELRPDLNPLRQSIQLGLYSGPAFVDIDNDGDLDLFVSHNDMNPFTGKYDGRVAFFENTGSDSAGAFIERIDTDNPLNALGLVETMVARPTFIDIDNDGDYDLFLGVAYYAGGPYSNILLYENTGTASDPDFQQSVASNPFDNMQPASGWPPVPSFGHLDGDSLIDAVVGNESGTLDFYKNESLPDTARFTKMTGTDNPLDTFSTYTQAVPVMLDDDGDGIFDIVVGDQNATLHHFVNTGTADSARFIQLTGTDNQFDPDDLIGGSVQPEFADLDADGDLDLFVGQGLGPVRHFEKQDTSFSELAGFQSPIGGHTFFLGNAPVFADIDGDLDQDLFVGDSAGVRFFENQRGSNFIEKTGTDNPVDLVDVLRPMPAFVDLDSNGTLDLVVGKYDGRVNVYLNTGTPMAPAFFEDSPLGPFYSINVSGTPTLAFADIDDDGDVDLILGEVGYGGGGRAQKGTDGAKDKGNLWKNWAQNRTTQGGGEEDTVRVYENTGGAANPAFNFSPIAQFAVGYSTAPSIIDIDQDGDYDIFVGSLLTPKYGALIRYLENTGTPQSPAWVEQVGPLNPFEAQFSFFNKYLIPAFADLDGDGDADALAGLSGVYGGKLVYYQNTSAIVTSTQGDTPNLAQLFQLHQNYPNPFNPTTTITYNLPKHSNVTLKVYNLLGQEVKTLVQGTIAAGQHAITWDGKDRFGKQVASGVYIYRLSAGARVQSRKFMFLK